MNKNTKYGMWFCEEPADAGYGNASERFEPLEQEPRSVSEVEEKPTEISKPNPVEDRRAFAKEIGQEFASHLTKTKEQEKPVPQMTPAEAKKALKVWEPDDAYFQRFDNLETRKAAFEEMRDRLVEQADTIAQARMYQMAQQFDARIKPQEQYLSRQETKERETEFFTTYSSLDRPSIRKNLPAIATQMANEGKFNGLTQDQAFAELARGVESVIKEYNPEFKLESAPTPKTNPGQNSNALQPSPRPGAGGGAGNQKQVASGPIASRILGPVGQSS